MRRLVHTRWYHRTGKQHRARQVSTATSGTITVYTANTLQHCNNGRRPDTEIPISARATRMGVVTTLTPRAELEEGGHVIE